MDRRQSIGAAVAVALLVGWGHPVAGQQPRTRSLTYDSESKKWIESPPPPPGTAEGDLHRIRVLNKDKKFRAAMKAVKEFIKDYGTRDANYPAVLIAKAESLIGREDYYKAHRELQSFLDQFGGMGLTTEALRLEFVIAETYLTGVKRKLWGLRWLSGEDVALEILDMISAEYPESRIAEYAVKTKADYLFAKGDHAIAELEYARLMREYPRSRYDQFALRRSAEAALASFGGVEYDEAALIEAEERYRDYQSRYPGAAERDNVALILRTIRERRAQKTLTVADYYERTDHVTSAIFYYRIVSQEWPDTTAATKASARLELLGAGDSVASAATGGPGT